MGRRRCTSPARTATSPSRRCCLEKGAAVDRARRAAETPLWGACRTGHVDVVRLLLDRGARFDGKRMDVACGWTHVAKLLIESDPDHVDQDGPAGVGRATRRGDDSGNVVETRPGSTDQSETHGRRVQGRSRRRPRKLLMATVDQASGPRCTSPATRTDSTALHNGACHTSRPSRRCTTRVSRGHVSAASALEQKPTNGCWEEKRR